MNRTLIDRFEAGGVELGEAILGLTPHQLTARLGPGQWSIHELVIHLADSDAIAIDRMKRVIAEDGPMLLCAEETFYVKELYCHDQSIDDAVTLFKVGRRQFARVLRLLPDAAFSRVGTHNVTGTMTLADLVETCVNHLSHHLDFLLRKRDKLENE